MRGKGSEWGLEEENLGRARGAKVKRKTPFRRGEWLAKGRGQKIRMYVSVATVLGTEGVVRDRRLKGG